MDPLLPQKSHLFHTLHHAPRAFIIPNPWDVGTAKLLAGMGFQALATTSAGYAYTRGLSDYQVTRDQMLAHVKELRRPPTCPSARTWKAATRTRWKRSRKPTA